MFDFIKNVFLYLVEVFVDPISAGLMEHFDITIPTIKVGFGSVEWFSMPLDVLLAAVLGFALSFIFLRLIYRLIKWLFRLGKGLVGIR